MPGDGDKIKGQVKEAEDIIDRELSQWDAENPISDDKSSEEVAVLPPEKLTDEDVQMDTVGNETEKPPEPNNSNDINADAPATTNGKGKSAEPQESSKDQGDDGGEVVEGEEDTVIY